MRAATAISSVCCGSPNFCREQWVALQDSQRSGVVSDVKARTRMQLCNRRHVYTYQDVSELVLIPVAW